MMLAFKRQEVTTGCGPLSLHLPRVKDKGGFSLGLAPLPIPLLPRDSEALERKCQYQMQSTEVTMVHTAHHRYSEEHGDHTVQRGVPHPHPTRRKRDPIK